MKLYQPVYLNKATSQLESVSMEVFATKEQAKGFGEFVANRRQKVEVIELNMEEATQ